MSSPAFSLLDSRVQKLVHTRFSEPTEIQILAIPAILEGKNVLAIAPTGFGKMESAVLPILSRLLEAIDAGARDGIQVIYITPLKALNRDMTERLEFWCHLLGIRLAVRHGDTTSSERAKQRDSPPQFMVTTPETLQSMLIAPKLEKSLENVKWVVVDEVHELADSKRGLQLSLGLQRLRLKTPKGFQIIGLSATVGSEEEVASILGENILAVKAHVEREIKARVEKPFAIKTQEFGELGISKDSQAGLERIVELIEAHKRTLLFVNTRYVAESIGSLLYEHPRARESVAVHHSSLSKEARVETEKEFKGAESKLKAVICTSSLELGIDVGEIDLVIQYVSPRQVSRFLQRVGRSGHRKDRVPEGIVLASDALDCFEAAVVVRRAKNGLLESKTVRKNAFDVAAHQTAGLAIDKQAIEFEQALEIMRKARPFATLSPQDYLEIVKQLEEARIISFDGKIIKETRKTRMYYYENVSTIRDSKKFFVKDATMRKNVGLLDESFVNEYVVPNATFIARGRAWKVLSVSEDEIAVEPTRDVSAAIPEWVGEEIPVERAVASETAVLIAGAGEKIDVKQLAHEYYCSPDAVKKILEFSLEQKKFFTPNPNEIVIESNKDFTVIHAFCGTKANETLSRALGNLFSAMHGVSVRTKASAYGFLMQFPKPVRANLVKEALIELSGRKIHSVLAQTLVNTALYRQKFVGVAKAFGVLSKKSELGGFGVRRLVEALYETPVYREALSELFYDKLDIETAAEALGRKISLLEERGEWSPLAKQFFNLGSFSELLAAAAPSEQVIGAFKENLLEKKTRLLCTYCGKLHTRSLSEEKSYAYCPYCSSTQITTEEYEEVYKKHKTKKNLNTDERKKLRDMRRVTALISSYGRRALLALETFGVGPENASRVLSRLQADENNFYADLLEAQKNFIKTRNYWKI